MGLEHLFTELFVATRLDSVEFEPVRVGVDVVGLGEHVRDRVERGDDSEHHADDDLLIRGLVLSKERDVLGDIVGHLRGRRRRAIFVLDHTVMELRGHGNNHVIEVGVEVAALRDIEAEGRRVMVASQEVVRVVRETGLMGTSLGELRRPDTHVGVLCLMNSSIWRPDAVVDLALTLIPLLEEVTTVLLMGGVNLGKVNHLLLEFSLLETLINEEIVLLMHGAVAALARTGEDLEAATETRVK